MEIALIFLQRLVWTKQCRSNLTEFNQLLYMLYFLARTFKVRSFYYALFTWLPLLWSDWKWGTSCSHLARIRRKLFSLQFHQEQGTWICGWFGWIHEMECSTGLLVARFAGSSIILQICVGSSLCFSSRAVIPCAEAAPSHQIWLMASPQR